MYISPEASIDLHMRTTYSDGCWTAEQLFDHLAQEGFHLVAITDHDRIETVTNIRHVGLQKHISVLAGVGISAAWHGQMGDVLCYGFDPYDTALQALAEHGLREPQEFTDYTPELLDQVRAEIPLDGIEVHYPTHSPEQVATYLAYAQQHGLLVSAGSDSHGPPGRMPIKYRAELCQPLLERVGVHVQ